MTRQARKDDAEPSISDWPPLCIAEVVHQCMEGRRFEKIPESSVRAVHCLDPAVVTKLRQDVLHEVLGM